MFLMLFLLKNKSNAFMSRAEVKKKYFCIALTNKKIKLCYRQILYIKSLLLDKIPSANFFPWKTIERLARTGPKGEPMELHLPGHNDIHQTKNMFPMLYIETIFLAHSYWWEKLVYFQKSS